MVLIKSILGKSICLLLLLKNDSLFNFIPHKIILDPAWQEMLNHATQRVNDAERDRGVAEGEHRVACVKHEAANAKVQNLQKELKRAITKSRYLTVAFFLQEAGLVDFFFIFL